MLLQQDFCLFIWGNTRDILETLWANDSECKVIEGDAGAMQGKWARKIRNRNSPYVFLYNRGGM